MNNKNPSLNPTTGTNSNSFYHMVDFILRNCHYDLQVGDNVPDARTALSGPDTRTRGLMDNRLRQDIRVTVLDEINTQPV